MQKDYNEPTLENIMREIKKLVSKVCPWGECPTCDKKTQDTGYGHTCYDCKQSKKKQDLTPTNDYNNF